MATITADVSDIMRKTMTINIQVIGARRALVRLWLGARLLKLAAWVIGCELKIEIIRKVD